MKFVIVLVALFGLALAAPAADEPKILRSDSNIGAEGYQFAVETSDGKSHSEEGQIQNLGAENEAIAVRGQFQYTDLEGNTFSVSYIADENGFQPQGAHLPVAPAA